MPAEDDLDLGQVSRRKLLGLAALAGGAAAAGGLVTAAPAEARAARQAAFPRAPRYTTLQRTLLHGPPNVHGYRLVVTGPGEASLRRNDLIGTAIRNPKTSRVPLVAFAQFTDLHLIDAQSPARLEFLDRLGDPGFRAAGAERMRSAYRPQEMLSLHVADAMIAAITRLAGGPVTGRGLDFAVCTGDNADNNQYNEVRWHIDLMDGGWFIRPDSGTTTKWEGVGGAEDTNTSYWHPDGRPQLGKIDHPQAHYGFPTVPGLLDRCRAPFAAPGITLPWYTTFGNHDVLVRGSLAPSDASALVATGSHKATAAPDGIDDDTLLQSVLTEPTVAVDLMADGPGKTVVSDSRRRELSRAQIVDEYFNTTGWPVGHGFTQTNRDLDTAYYTFSHNGIVFISLDTVTPEGGPSGSLDQAQHSWLIDQLDRNHSRRLDTNGKWVAGAGKDRLIVLLSHHTIGTMHAALGSDRVDGTTVANTALRYPNVVAWVNGHVHRNQVKPHPRPHGWAAHGGFWEITTASHIDWPQQSRLLEIVDNADGTLSIFGTLIDHAGPPGYGHTPTTSVELAALSRELGMNDWQRNAETATTDGQRGRVRDRNVELICQHPLRR